MSAPQLDSRKLSCLQHMGITVWQRRATVVDPVVSPVADAEITALASASATEPTTAPATAPAGETLATSIATESAAVKAAAIARSDSLLPMPVEIAASDRSIRQASVVIARASIPGQVATALHADEYQLLIKMMESIGITAGQWVAVTESTQSRDSSAGDVSAETLTGLTDRCGSDVLLLLLPATELSRWAGHWADLAHCAEQANQMQIISSGARPLALAPLCDPRDLLQNGALKRDAWECLKVVRAHLSKRGVATVG